MNVWAWVESLAKELDEAGQQRLIDMIYGIPHDCHEDRPSRVEALLPEAIAAARTMKNPWLEVFFRHWGMVNRLNNLAQGQSALDEAVSLFEFAHREETMNCPQSICVTQDIAICYARTDGPGWVAERLAVCDETLARIEPARQCFDCISREYASALLDDKKPEQAIVFLDRQAEQMRQARNSLSVAFRFSQATALKDAGHLDEALTLLQQIDDDNQDDDDSGDRLSRRMMRAQIYAIQERFDEALELLPSSQDLIPIRYVPWLNTMLPLASARPELNTWQIGRKTQRMLDYLHSVGSHRDVFDFSIKNGRLALARGSAWTARRSFARAQETLPLLRAPLGADEQLAQLKTALDNMPSHAPLPVAADALYDFIKAEEAPNPEQHIDWLLAASAERPDDAALADLTASAMQACQATMEAQQHLRQYIDAHPNDDGMMANTLATSFLEQQQYAQLNELIQSIQAHQPKIVHWLRARLAYAQERWLDVAEHAQAYISVDNEAVGAHSLWAQACMAAKNFDDATHVYEQMTSLIEGMGGDTRNAHWDVMWAASSAQRWDVVRRHAALAEVTLTDMQPNEIVEEKWGWVRLNFYEDGEWRQYFAHRTGPTTARVRTITGNRVSQRVNDWVVFNPYPLDPVPEDEADRENFIQLYRATHTLESAHYKGWFVDGARMDDEKFDVFVEQLDKQGYPIWHASSSNYSVKRPDGDEDDMIPGIYFYIASPPDVTPAQVCQLLTQATADFDYPLCWLYLAESANVDADKHREIAKGYGF